MVKPLTQRSKSFSTYLLWVNDLENKKKEKKKKSALQLVVQYFQNIRSRMEASRFLLIQVYMLIKLNYI